MGTNRSEKFLSSRDRPNVHPLHVSRFQRLHLILARPPRLLERKINNKAESFFCFHYIFTTVKFYRSGERENEKC